MQKIKEQLEQRLAEARAMGTASEVEQLERDLAQLVDFDELERVEIMKQNKTHAVNSCNFIHTMLELHPVDRTAPQDVERMKEILRLLNTLSEKMLFLS